MLATSRRLRSSNRGQGLYYAGVSPCITVCLLFICAYVCRIACSTSVFVEELISFDVMLSMVTRYLISLVLFSFLLSLF